MSSVASLANTIRTGVVPGSGPYATGCMQMLDFAAADETRDGALR